MPSFKIGKRDPLSGFTDDQLEQLPQNNEKVQKAKARRAVDLPKIKEEMSLVQKILREMGCDCGMKKHSTPEEVAKKHGKSLKYINKQLKAGIQVEHEHTSNEHEAETIALQHLAERPDYYERLKKVEGVNEAKKYKKKNEDDPCWDGYEQVGTKKKNGKEVPNCVPVKESYRLPAQNGQLLHIVHAWRGRTMMTQLFFPSGRVPSRMDVADAINKVYPDSRLLSYRIGDLIADKPLVQVGNSKSKNYLLNNSTIGESTERWQKANKKDRTDGMGAEAIKKYRKDHPGSKLQAAVTDPEPEGKDAKRQKNYCDRSKGQKKMHSIDCNKTPDKPICKARKRWHCDKYD